MACCGIPTLTCVLLLLFLAALYVGASSSDNDDNFVDKSEEQSILVRAARAIRGKGSSTGQKKKTPVNRTGPGSFPGTGKNKAGKKLKKKKKKNHIKDWTDRKKGSQKRPLPRVNNKDALPAGVTPQMMRLATKVHGASTPFAARLFQVLTVASPRQIVVSPFSIHTALTMTMLGAKGPTEKEMSVVLGHRQVGLRKKKPHKGYKALLASLGEKPLDFKLYSANGVFVRPGLPLEDSFRQGLIRMYNASFDSFQLQHPQGPEAPINHWVSQVTRDRIKDIVPAKSITSNTALVIINAVYFNASWSQPFVAELTQPNKFYAYNGSIQTVDTMSTTTTFGYANHHNTEVIELLYKGDRLAMYILLPNAAYNITQLQQSLVRSGHGSSPVDELLENLKQERILLYLPKFRVETGVLDLKQPLQEMGIKKAFELQADFSGISTTGDFYISAVMHKAFIEVTEKGTEAAAATSVIIFPSSAVIGPPPPREVRVNRPFMFIIRDKLMKEILFIGTYIG